MSNELGVNPDHVIGVTVCSNCQKRFRIPKKHEGLIGKSIRCPQCHESFVVQLDVPSQIEQAAIQNAESCDSQKARATRNRRTKSQIREEHLVRIRDALKTFHKRLADIAQQPECTEEQVRIWCVGVLKSALGYEDHNIDTEVRALGQRIDIALKEDDKIFLVIECKNPRSKLPNSVREQAVMYAANKSSDWAVGTNGSIWKLWRVIPISGRDPEVVEVFNIVLIDDDGVSEQDVANFYLLTKRALFNGETAAEAHFQRAASNQRLLRALTSDRVVSAFGKALTESYHVDCNEKITLTDDFVASRIAEMFLPDEL